jgi:UDP-N-acetylmuramate dehydrogenase
MLGLRFHGHDSESVTQMKEELAALQNELEREGLVARRDEPMRDHTAYQIGGPADLFVIASSEQELVCAVRKAREHGFPPFILGGGANLLVADAGIRGVVIVYRGNAHTFRQGEGEVILWSEAGALLRQLARESVERGLQGLEWAVDLPGTVGGAVVGNAGAFGGYICDCVRTIKTLEPDGTVRELQKADAGFCYRGSRFKQQSRQERTVILDAALALRSGDAAEIADLAARYTARRWERHPREPSCGSVFKKSGNYPAGFLIEQCGLKGERRGNAVISPKHANFVVNLGGAKAADVRALIELAQERVKAQFGQELELEVELVGEW